MCMHAHTNTLAHILMALPAYNQLIKTSPQGKICNFDLYGKVITEVIFWVFGDYCT